MAVTETPPQTVTAAVGPDPLLPRTQPSGLAAVLGSGDHKVIGRLYLVTSFLFGAAVLVLGGLFAVESIKPRTVDVFTTDTVFQFFTLYRIGTVFLFALPLVIGLAMVVVPLQVGARTVAFPRAAAASYWIWLMGSVLVIASYAVNGGPAGGRAKGVDLWIAAMGVIVIGLLIASISLATTVLALRAPGLTLQRTPFYAWSVAVAAVLWLLTLPALLALLIAMYVDHRHGATSVGANLGIFPRVLWVLRNPEIYVVAIPVLGFVADVFATTAKARFTLRGPAQAAIGAFGVLSFGAFLAASDPQGVRTPLAIGMALLALVAVLALLGSAGEVFRRGTFSFNGGFLWAACSLLALLLGVAAGALGSIPGLHTSGTIYDLGVSHAVVLAAAIATLGGVHWWATKVVGRPLKEAPAHLAPLLLLLGTALIVLPDLVTGLVGKNRQLAPDYTGGMSGTGVVAAIGVVVVALGFLAFLGAVFPVLKRGDSEAPTDPWEGQTLEWLTPSPPPLGNFDLALPLVTTPEPLIDLREEQ
jgi:heme/copper-type cytochrome/quinol oxidase subunit 1